MVGEDNFNQFLNDVFDGASKKIRDEIVSLARKHGFNIRIATEEYLAEMAEKGIKEPTFWDKVKQLFRKLLEKIGYKWQITDNDLSYLLWENYYQLRQSQNPLHVAKETGMRAKMGIGEFAKREENETRFREEFFQNRPAIIKEYDSAIDNGFFRFQEAFQDSMLSVKVLQDTIVKATGKKIRSFEDAWQRENTLSSQNKVDGERFFKKFFVPLMDQVKKLSDKYGRERVEDYIYAKSGLERNEVILQRDANKELQESIQDLDKKLEKDEITQPQYDALVKTVQQRYNETIAAGGDFSGLTGLVQSKHQEELEEMLEEGQIDKAEFSRRMKQIGDTYKDFAENMVSKFEKDVPSAEVDQLWNLINAATHETLNIRFQSGLLNKEQYEKIKGMMKYYVPLKGWDKLIAEDVYDYSHVDIAVQKEKSAKGRTSLADNPIANISLSAQNAIIMGNKNRMKQNFFNFLLNRPNELAVIRDVWYARTNNTVHGQVEAIYPEINESDGFEDIQKKLNEFEERMKKMEADGTAFRGKIPFGLTLVTKSRQKAEHMVSVMINGQEYIIYINGNPRAAQALNGQTNPEGVDDWIKWYNSIKRIQNAANTSFSPIFLISNLFRDLIQAPTMVYLEKGPLASAYFVKNTKKSIEGVTRGLSGKYDPSNKVDVYFKEFIENGGETGYTAIQSIDDYKKEYEKILKGESKFDKVKSLFQWIETLNRFAEDINRFNAYMSSREAGENIANSIAAAKNITVNFNKKGALTKGKGAWAKIAGFLNFIMPFFNAFVQGNYQIYKIGSQNKKRLYSLISTIIISGTLMPVINSIWAQLLHAVIGTEGGDDDDYFAQTDYTRMNNWLIWTGKGYVKIPLPPVFREIYGLGDILYRLLSGRITIEKSITAIAKQIQNAFSPIAVIPNSGDMSMASTFAAFTPSVFSPIADIMQNEDFMGRKIYNDMSNEYLPEYKRVYKGVSPVFVESSRVLNLLGGDDAKRSPYWIANWNPAILEHLLTSYTGGVGKTISNIAGVGFDLVSGNTDNIEFRKIPIASNLYTPSNDETERMYINRLFKEYEERYERAKVAKKSYENLIKNEKRTDLNKRLEIMKKNGELKFIQYFDSRMKILRKLKKRFYDTNDNTEKQNLEKRISELEAEMIVKSKSILE